MRWKRISNLITAWILSLIYTIVTLLNIIGPLHMNSTGAMNPLSAISAYSIIYWALALLLTWGVYFYWYKKPKILFFSLIILGIVIIVIENFMWGWVGP